jgi:hypothetical protein
MRVFGRRLGVLALTAALLATSLLAVWKPVSAADLTTRSLTLSPASTPTDVDSDSVDDGASLPLANSNHAYVFTFVTSDDIGSIQFLYCTTAAGTCTMPPGLDTTNITAITQDNNVNGFTLNDTTNGAPYITRAAAAATPQELTFTLHDVVNPTATNTTFFVRITIYDAAALGGNTVDDGVVAASTANRIRLRGTMPESLVFCTGQTVPLTIGGLPNCGGATNAIIDFNDLFSTTITRYATSQMAASTNAGDGYVITVSGPTMESGSNSIPEIGGTGVAPTVGISQFGLNVVENLLLDVSPVGEDPTPVSNAANYRANPMVNYDTPDEFAFVDNNPSATATPVANSNDGGSGPWPSDNQRYTATYIVNVAGSQAAGEYTTTLTYVCTPTF